MKSVLFLLLSKQKEIKVVIEYEATFSGSNSNMQIGEQTICCLCPKRSTVTDSEVFCVPESGFAGLWVAGGGGEDSKFNE